MSISAKRLFSQGAQKVQSGFGQLSALAKGYTKLPQSSKLSQHEGLSARYGRQEQAPIGPRNNAAPGAAKHAAPQGPAHAVHSAAARPQGTSQPPARPAPPRPAPSHYPTAAQHFQQSHAKPSKFAAPPGRPAGPHSATTAQSSAGAAPAAKFQPPAQAKPRPVGLQHALGTAHGAAAARPANVVHAQRPATAAVPRPAVSTAEAGKPEQTPLEKAAEALLKQVRASDRQLYDLINLRDNAEMDGDYDAADDADDAIDALKEQRTGTILMSNILNGADRGGARQMGMLRDFSRTPEPVVSGDLGSQRRALQSNAAALRRAREQFGPIKDLAANAETLKAALKGNNVPQAARAELEAMLRGFANYSALEKIVAECDRAIRRMGGQGLMDSIPTTAAERRAADEAEQRRHQESVSNGY
ncbi:hypothetical protein [Paracidovorax konjaci]|uniref:Uncharacterized protein n=1 Tax=Paracidovorax konjaci TaxID=32040 RepID=A0A1I1W2Y4_9BURK|nr:hypothetical protein [Paracidovorax konjaci]SFD89515.1 hypothetical protein SAMN04489710_10876 [Paracidovorax konjaci]